MRHFHSTVFDFLVKLAFLAVVAFYFFAAYEAVAFNFYWIYDIRNTAINLVCPATLLLLWFFAQKAGRHFIPPEIKHAKKTSRLLTVLFTTSGLAFVAWLIAYPLIFTRTQLLGKYILFDKNIMAPTLLLWIGTWLFALLFSHIKMPVRAASGFLFTGMCGFLGKFGFYARSFSEEFVRDFLPKLFTHHLIPVYVGLVCFAASYFVLKRLGAGKNQEPVALRFGAPPISLIS